ncbi:MAG: hypothetical protein NTY31_00905 [Candidatus Falkowbacteria bacterium]|nr:hypothetical protein [Candidatus Falkowbacteria bacterium]
MSHEIKNMNNMGSQHEHHDHEELFNSAWAESQENFLVKGLKTGKRIEDLLPNLPGFNDAFSKVSLLDCPGCRFECSDGRVKSGGPKVALAGEGILLDDADRKILIEALRGKNLPITGHESCGAVKMAHPEDANSDKYGYKGAEELAAETGNKYEAIDHGKFRSQVHDERALVVEGTLKFNCSDWTEFPPQFLSSAAALGLSDAYPAKEVKALAGIALGDHGFGGRFDSNNPFYIIVSAKDSEQLGRLLEIGRAAVKDFGDRAKVDGFVAPVKE